MNSAMDGVWNSPLDVKPPYLRIFDICISSPNVQSHLKSDDVFDQNNDKFGGDSLKFFDLCCNSIINAQGGATRLPRYEIVRR